MKILLMITEMKKILILIFTFLGASLILATNLTADLEEVYGNLTALENKYSELKPSQSEEEQKTEEKRKLKEQQREEQSQKLYNNLYEALYKPTYNEMKAELANIDQWTATRVVEHIIDLLKRDSIEATDIAEKDIVEALRQPISIRAKTFEVIDLPRPVFVARILLIAKIVETIFTTHKSKDTISILSDELFHNPLYIYLLVSSLHFIGYNSIEINLLLHETLNYGQLDNTLKDEFKNLKWEKINQYKSVENLIDSGKKIDMYLINFTIPKESNAFTCQGKITATTDKPIIYDLFAAHSNKEASDYIFSTKSLNDPRINESKKKKVIENLLHNLINPGKLKGKGCTSLGYSYTDLADIIYSMSKANNKIPLMVCSFSVRDTGTGIDLSSVIIDSRLNFKDYSELLAAIFITDLARETNDFEKVATIFELYGLDKIDTTKLILLNSNLNKIPSIIKTFLRKVKLIAPSETKVED